jgi:predicted  nucleic acid-binding Zn-ribbon protein
MVETLTVAGSFIREFGMATLAFLAGGYGVWHLVGMMREDLRQAHEDLKESREENKRLQAQILELSKSAILTISDLTKITEEFSPAVSALGTAQKEHLTHCAESLKEHLSHKLELLQKILEGNK